MKKESNPPSQALSRDYLRGYEDGMKEGKDFNASAVSDLVWASYVQGLSENPGSFHPFLVSFYKNMGVEAFKRFVYAITCSVWLKLNGHL